ncbi:MAG: HD domain-containing protein [Clostridiaceae bacterium]|nr:HD domain-containing protein [Clostridiaceae bacterium]
MNIEDMKAKLKRELSPARFQHSLGVMAESIKLARFYNIDQKKAGIAGLLHDCAKHLNSAEVLALVEEKGLIVDDILINTPSLHHGIAAPIIASEQYGVSDGEILDAIYWHSTGRAGMTPLEKIVFVADYIEPGRKFGNLHEARKAAYEDINRCILMLAELTIMHVLKKGDFLHPDTINARNDALMNVKKGIKGLTETL